MIGNIGNILSGAQSAVVQTIKNTQRLLDKVQLRLASGKDVNSALDNPANFFLSLSLSQKAEDLRKLLDGISLNIEALKANNAGAEAILKVIDQAEALLGSAVEELYSGTATSLATSLSSADITAVLAANPGLTYSPDTQSFYQISAGTATWAAANTIAENATLIEPPNVFGVEGVTGHLAVITSQIENDFVDAIVPNTAWLGGSDAAVEGEWRWTGGPESGQQFWQGLHTGSTVAGSYANWGAGEPNNSGAEDNMHMRADGRWNDQAGTTSYRYVIEWDASLFVTSSDPELAERAMVYSEQYIKILDQIDLLAKDTQYRGIGLLHGDTLRTDFNVPRTSLLITEGMDASSLGLGLSSTNFLRLSTLNLAQEQVRNARSVLRAYSGSLANDLNIITTRLDFTKGTIDTHQAGSDDLVVADKNEVGAELLALEVSRQLQTTALSLSTQDNVSRLFS